MFGNVSMILKFVIIIIVYLIIFYALKIMYKDVKNPNGAKKRRKKVQQPKGLEVMKNGENKNLKIGGVIPIQGELTIGRRNDNQLVISDKYISSHHATIYLNENEIVLEDLGSTNGTFVNDYRCSGKVRLKDGDVVKIGTVEFKVIA